MDHTHPSAISMEPIPNVPRLTELPRGTEGGSRETVPYRLLPQPQLLVIASELGF